MERRGDRRGEKRENEKQAEIDGIEEEEIMREKERYIGGEI